MSTEDSTSVKETSEQDVEVPQEDLQPLDQQPDVEGEGDLERDQENIDDGGESSCSVVADDTSHLSATDEKTKPQSGLPDGGTGIEDSQESSTSGVGSSAESQQSGENGGISRQLSQENAAASSGDSCSRASLENGVAGGDSNSQDSKESSSSNIGFWEDTGTESLQDSSNGTALQLPSVVNGPCRRVSPEGASTTSSSICTESQQDSSNGTSLQLPSVVNAPCRRDTPEGASSTSSSTGDSSCQAASSGDSCSRASLESGDAGVVSNRRDSKESSSSNIGFLEDNGTESRQDSSNGPALKLSSLVGDLCRRDTPEGASATSSSTGTESQQEYSNGTALQLHSVVGPCIQDPLEGASAFSSSTGDSSYHTAQSGDSCSEASLESGVVGGVSNSQDSKESYVGGTESLEGIAAPVAPPTASSATLSDLRSPAAFQRNANQRTPPEESLSWEDRLLRELDRMMPFARGLRKAIIFNRALLFVLAVATIYMGIKNDSQCPGKEMLPFYCTYLGCFGIMLLGSTFLLDLRNLMCPNADRRRFYFATVIIFVLFVWYYIDVLSWTCGVAPSFDPDSENYCNETFYYFSISLNVVVGILLLSAMFIYFYTRNDSSIPYVRL